MKSIVKKDVKYAHLWYKLLQTRKYYPGLYTPNHIAQRFVARTTSCCPSSVKWLE